MKATRFTLCLIGFILLLLGGLNAHATEFYVSMDGNDGWDGTAAAYEGGTTGPWKTIDKVNQQMAQLEGRSVLFRSGDQFEGMLEISGNNIRFGAYGEGVRPVLSGARHMQNVWSPVPGKINVYQQALSDDVTDVTLLLRGTISLPLGRTPNGDLMTNAAFYDFSARTLTSVTDPELSNAEELKGAEIVLRQNVWTYSNYSISSIDGPTINFLNERPRGIRQDEAGYFFQKHIKTLDLDGEWFYDANNQTLYLYSDTPPESTSLRYTAIPVVINIVNSKNILLQGLRIEMAASTGIKVTGSQHIEIEDCEIALCGQVGISVDASTVLIQSNSIIDCLSTGIQTVGEGRVVISDNNISNIGMIPGRGSGRNGISLRGGNSEASYNRLSNIGYIGIHHTNGGNLIRRNVFDGYNLVTFDGGAIYTHGNQNGSVVEENIIMNGMPGFIGLGSEMADMEVAFATGIQLDRGTTDLIVRNNTISFPQIGDVPDRGIHLNAISRDNIIKGNTILVRGAGITTLERRITRMKTGEAPMSGNLFEENIIVSTATSDTRPNYGALTAFSLKDTDLCAVKDQGTFRNNVCAFPFRQDKIINEYALNCNPDGTHADHWFDSAAAWNDARDYASGNLDAPVKMDESSAPEDFIRLYYNDSDNMKTFHLSDGAYLDPWGNPVTGSITVAPWRSMVLFKKP